jgi:hypothetical protein
MQRNMSKLAGTLGLGLFLGVAGTATAAEPQAGLCAGIQAADRSGELIEGRGARVEHVEQLTRKARIGKMTYDRPAGMRIFVRPEAGLSVPYLQRAVNCALAERAARGGSDPLASGEVRATVRSADHHFVVDLVGASHATAQALASRADTAAASQVATSR